MLGAFVHTEKPHLKPFKSAVDRKARELVDLRCHAPLKRQLGSRMNALISTEESLVTSHQLGANRWSRPALKASVSAWFCIAVLGQLIFVFYIFALYGRATLAGNFEGWNAVMPRGFVPGDTAQNVWIGLHLLFAALITVCGALQLTPQVRQHVPRLHRMTGRFYIGAAVIMSSTGLMMVWLRGAVGDLPQHIAISLNGLLILLAAGMALWHAINRRIALHRPWALRLFLAVSGVWFFRITLMLWIVVNQGPAGFDPVSFTGPGLTTMAFACYVLVPWAVLELYLHAQKSSKTSLHLLAAAALAVLSLLMLAGIAAATQLMWLPRI